MNGVSLHPPGIKVGKESMTTFTSSWLAAGLVSELDITINETVFHVCTYVHVWVSFSKMPSISFEAGFITSLKLSDQTRLAGPQSPKDALLLASLVQD